jgi:TRAP-type transport system periplasmic protein
VRQIDRRRLIGGTCAVLGTAGWPRRSRAAEFTLKYGNDVPDSHPIHKRMLEAADIVRQQTNGRVELQVFGNSQLGSSTDMLSQVRSGALELMTVGTPLANLVPLASMNAVAFAFKDHGSVWTAMDGEVGAYIRQRVRQAGIVPFEKMWDNGYRQITTSTKPVRSPADLKGMKLRVPVNALYTSLFRSLGAAPTAINFVEVYSALQTGVVDGQENPLALIDTGRFYEVQKYCSMTGHTWEGFWMVASRQAWEALPGKLQEIVSTVINEAAERQRKDMQTINASLEVNLQAKGLQFNKPDPIPFRDTLRSAGFYAEWRGKFGEEAWKVLEKYTGALG